LREWFPFLWGDITEEERIIYSSILRRLDEIADIFDQGGE